jgi:hypothetical protein
MPQSSSGFGCVEFGLLASRVLMGRADQRVALLSNGVGQVEVFLEEVVCR